MFGALLYTTAAGGAPQSPGRDLLTGGAPCYRCYETADGRHLALGALEPRFFATFCHIAGRPELANRGFQWGAGAIETIEILSHLFKEKTAEGV